MTAQLYVDEQTVIDIYAAVCRRALLDASKRSDRSAIEFLDYQIPDWKIRSGIKENRLNVERQSQ